MFAAPYELVTACLTIGWLLAAIVVAALATRRLRLWWLKRQALTARSTHINGELAGLRSRIAAVESWGQTLTTGLVAYTALIMFFLSYRVVQEVVRKMTQILELL